MGSEPTIEARSTDGLVLLNYSLVAAIKACVCLLFFVCQGCNNIHCK